MAKSAFRLTTILKLRESARDERRHRLAEAVQAAEVLDTRRAEIDADLRQLRGDARQHCLPGSVDLERLLAAGRHELELRAEQQLLDDQRQTIETEIDARRHQLAEADREVRVIEKLRERYDLRDRDERRRQEQKRLDEVAALRSRKEHEPW